MSYEHIEEEPPRKPLKTGKDLAIEGAQAASNNADRVCPDWSERAYRFFLAWAKKHGGTFLTEDVRMAAEQSGSYVRPPDERAWGAVILRAKRQGLLEHAGYAPMKSRNCHANPKSVWRLSPTAQQ